MAVSLWNTRGSELMAPAKPPTTPSRKGKVISQPYSSLTLLISASFVRAVW
jgi:hypothetical protein